jgi:hypothetical protein
LLFSGDDARLAMAEGGSVDVTRARA